MAVFEHKTESNSPNVGDASEDEQSEGQDGGRDLVEGNQGWANVFAKVLTQNPKVKKTKKSLVLVKAKKDADLERQRQAKSSKKSTQESDKSSREPLKIVDKQGNVVDEEEPSSEEEHEDEDSSTDDEAQDLKKLGTLEKLRLRKQRMEFGLITPMAGDPYEKNLLRTATRGVIQLFNAVNKFQDEKKKKKKKDDDSSDEEERRYKKGRFMETLTRLQEKQKADDGQSTSKWEALREDFMTNSKMRDWDKQNDDSDAD